MAEFPALNGQSVSYAVLHYPAGTVNPPHTHPRSAVLPFLVYGTLQVRFVNTTNKLIPQTLQEGGMIVFPKGLVHFHYNADGQNPTLAISGMGSANAGAVSVPNNVFTTSIDDNIFSESFKTDAAAILQIKGGLGSKTCLDLLNGSNIGFEGLGKDSIINASGEQIASLAIVQMAIAGDADITSDFVLPSNVTQVNGTFFTFTGMRVLVGAEPPVTFKVLKSSIAEFPALNGQSVSYAVLQFPASSVNPPHTHPRSAELLFLAYGTLQVGFVDTTNKLFTQTLQAGDIFVFPKGLVHFQYNADEKNPALAISGFGSANAGTASVPTNVFTTGIDDNILAKSFKTDIATIQQIKAALAPKP
ncbi:hypothetical protein F0562_022283 [Nyssa sinensis]|uniref:Cupin type-1 domain-containing protein n=1 Tax=Nyssa sinensis TaxID=561372 RepID=A0A5J5BSR4_9ASTE|nr:hypothetical protein F0562_022283 [Nyssa sinensis]